MLVSPLQLEAVECLERANEKDPMNTQVGTYKDYKDNKDKALVKKCDCCS